MRTLLARGLWRGFRASFHVTPIFGPGCSSSPRGGMRERSLVGVIRHIMSPVYDKGQAVTKSYTETVRVLNSLQSNAKVLERIHKEQDSRRHRNIPMMINYLERVGIKLPDLDRLSVIHVSGTKGKGSTCAFTESILRCSGYKTGFFSSPHLVEVRERVRINGKPLAREDFCRYFWEIYTRLQDTKSAGDDSMPAYFAFLTVLGLHVFLQEKVDVAILEVGIGGQYDSTNVVANPAVCGVTSLGLDHISILGSTIDKIAWHKAGIFKKDCPAVTARQPPEAMEVLAQRSLELKAPLFLPAKLEEFAEAKSLSLGIKGRWQQENAALALQLCQLWQLQHRPDSDIPVRVNLDGCIAGLHDNIALLSPFPLSAAVTQGLSSCQWLGRIQTVQRERLTYYLDGAHTKESMEQCVEWFQEASKAETIQLRCQPRRLLVYNSTGDRDVGCLLTLLKSCQFDAAVFCPNLVKSSGENRADQTNAMVTTESQRCKSLMCKQVWDNINVSIAQGTPLLSDVLHPQASCKEADGTPDDIHVGWAAVPNGAVDQSTLQGSMSQLVGDPVTSSGCSVAFTCASHALYWVGQGRDPSVPHPTNWEEGSCPSWLSQASHIQVLVTGSLHLVGCVLGLIEPHLADQ